MIVLEPSCAAVFRDELTNLFPTSKDAQRLSSQTFLLSEFLAKHAPGFKPPAFPQKILLHGHCHHKSLMGMDDEKKILRDMHADLHEPEDGCCGMAGAFGYEKGDHYDVSIKCGERLLLPEVRNASDDTLILTDGFSCREQIHQETDRHALHLAEILQRAIHKGPQPRPGERPEQALVRHRARRRRTATLRTAVGLLAFTAAVAAAIVYARRK
jgi:Fe-S oxidoreductase